MAGRVYVNEELVIAIDNCGASEKLLDVIQGVTTLVAGKLASVNVCLMFVAPELMATTA